MKFTIFLLSTLFFIACSPNSIEKDGGIVVVVYIEDSSQLEELVTVLQNRFKTYTKSTPVFSTFAEKGMLEIEIPGERDIELFKRIIGSKTYLEILETYSNTELTEHFLRANSRIVEHGYSGFDSLEINKGKALQYPLFSILQPRIDHNGRVFPGAEVGLCNIGDTARVNEILSYAYVANEFPEDVEFKWSKVNYEGKLLLVATKKAVNYMPITSSMIKNAVSDQNHYGEYTLLVNLKKENHITWEKLTANNIGKSLSIVINNEVYSSPTVQSEIKGGSFQISGSFTEEEIKELAVLLSEQVLCDLQISSVHYVSPTK